MKTLLILLVAALTFVAIGCEEHLADPIVASNPPKPAAAVLQKIVIDERLAVKTPEGFTGAVDVAGEITYRMTKTEVALGKELPVAKKTVYNAVIAGQGVMTLQPSTGLAKASTYRFSGNYTMMFEEGEENVELIFKISDASWSGTSYRVGFTVGNGTLEKNTSRIFLFPEIAE